MNATEATVLIQRAYAILSDIAHPFMNVERYEVEQWLTDAKEILKEAVLVYKDPLSTSTLTIIPDGSDHPILLMRFGSEVTWQTSAEVIQRLRAMTSISPEQLPDPYLPENDTKRREQENDGE